MILQILFESSWRFKHPTTVFKFRDRIFKLFRGKKTIHVPIKGLKNRWPGMDCLATVADEPLYPNEVAKIALIYLGCLSWEYKTENVYRGSSGFGTRMTIDTDLKNLQQLTFARRNYRVTNEYLEIDQIPYCSSEEHFTAIGLYREAMAADSPYYKFLCFWNILSIRDSSNNSYPTKGWINKTLKERFSHHFFSETEIKEIRKNTLVGKHFAENYKNALSHVKRYKPTKTNTINVNDLQDISMFSLGASILEKLARYYVEKDLGMDQKLYLCPGKIKEYKL